jgi:NADH-quinone oxidoreductase subunit M
MILALLVLVPLAAGLLAWPVGLRRGLPARVIALAGTLVDLGLVILLWARFPGAAGRAAAAPLAERWLEQLDVRWIPELGMRIHLAVDGLSLLMVSLTALLGVVAVAVSWKGIGERVGLFHFQVLFALAGIMGVFLALDLFLFLLFWEMMLVPTYFLIVIWGHENRRAAGLKFFLFTQSGGLLMLLSILGLHFIHGAQTGEYTFDALRLAATNLSETAGVLLMLGFFLAFAVKLPAFPLHPWLPDAHTAAPTAGSIILAGLLLKTGAYGLIRFAVPLFPAASVRLVPWATVMAIAGIVYGGVAAFGQKDMKRLIAYTSVSHLGFVLLGIYAGTPAAMEGAVLLMVCHGITTGALFALAGSVQDRFGTRDMASLGGVWSSAPRLAAMTLLFALAAMGLPGMGNFAGEFLVLLGVFAVRVLPGVLAATAMIISVIYALSLVRRTMFGPAGTAKPGAASVVAGDLGAGEMVVMATLTVVILYLGLFPQTLLGAVRPFLQTLPGVGP